MPPKNGPQPILYLCQVLRVTTRRFDPAYNPLDKSEPADEFQQESERPLSGERLNANRPAKSIELPRHARQSLQWRNNRIIYQARYVLHSRGKESGQFEPSQSQVAIQEDIITQFEEKTSRAAIHRKGFSLNSPTADQGGLPWETKLAQ